MPYATKASEGRAISRDAQCTDLVGIEDRRVPEHGTDTTHAADDLLDGGLLYLLVAMLGFLYVCFSVAKYFNEDKTHELFQSGLLGRDGLLEGLPKGLQSELRLSTIEMISRHTPWWKQAAVEQRPRSAEA